MRISHLYRNHMSVHYLSVWLRYWHLGKNLCLMSLCHWQNDSNNVFDIFRCVTDSQAWFNTHGLENVYFVLVHSLQLRKVLSTSWLVGFVGLAVLGQGENQNMPGKGIWQYWMYFCFHEQVGREKVPCGKKSIWTSHL